MSNPQLAAVYREAAEVIRTNGHRKNRFCDSNLRVCTLGALSIAVTGDPEPPEELDGLLAEAVADLSPRIDSTIADWDPEERIADWNDEPERTADEVVDALLLAAKAVAA